MFINSIKFKERRWTNYSNSLIMSPFRPLKTFYVSFTITLFTTLVVYLYILVYNSQNISLRHVFLTEGRKLSPFLWQKPPTFFKYFPFVGLCAGYLPGLRNYTPSSSVTLVGRTTRRPLKDVRLICSAMYLIWRWFRTNLEESYRHYKSRVSLVQGFVTQANIHQALKRYQNMELCTIRL